MKTVRRQLQGSSDGDLEVVGGGRKRDKETMTVKKRMKREEEEGQAEEKVA